MPDLYYYDIRAEEQRLRKLQRDMDFAETMNLSKAAALAEHPVTKYVKHLPVESALYPAISSLDLDGGQIVNGEGQEGQETPVYVPREYLVWNMPGHDLKRPRDRGCGFIPSPNGGVVYTCCPKDHDHNLKAKKFHCWSLKCPVCMNDTALKQAVSIEKQLLAYATLTRKHGAEPGRIGHWVVSPPQEYCKRMVQTPSGYAYLTRYIQDSLVAHGATAGVTVFHPWRQTEYQWDFSPHFHILCYGRIDTTSFRKRNPGWVIKKVHPRERIRSIRHTAAYLLTHSGIGLAEVDPDTVDWTARVLDLIIPEGEYTAEDHDLAVSGKGRMVGDLSGVDWLEWTMKPLSRETRIRYWGGASRKNIRSVDVYRQYKIRVCGECTVPLRTYDGYSDLQGQLVRYIQDNTVYAFASDVQRYRALVNRYRASLRSKETDLADLVCGTTFAASTLEFGLPASKDITVPDGFSEPDSFFLNRQRRAYGIEIQVNL